MVLQQRFLWLARFCCQLSAATFLSVRPFLGLRIFTSIFTTPLAPTAKNTRFWQSLASELTHEMTMTEFTPLDVDDMMAAYRHSKSRVILLDYGGSLLEKEVLLCMMSCVVD